MSDRQESEERQEQVDEDEEEDEDEDEDEAEAEDAERPSRAGAGQSFREAAESAPVTINDMVELEEDDDDDEEFQPDEAEEEEEEDEAEDEDEETEEALTEEGADDELERSVEREEAEDEELGEAEGEQDEAEGEDGEPQAGAELLRDAALSSFVSRVMQADGPTVKTVLLKADGTQQELTLDMTPRLNAAGAVLGCKASFVGQYASLDTVILQRRDQSNAQLPVNQHRLPAPFESDEVRGDVLLVRMDRQSAPQHLTLAEWQHFAATGSALPNGQQTAGGGEAQDGDATAGGSELAGDDGQQKKKRRTE